MKTKAASIAGTAVFLLLLAIAVLLILLLAS